MKIGKQFKQLTYKEYLQVLENHKKYTDFNRLGLFRSLHETEKLSAEERKSVLDLALEKFGKTFEFLQLKDPFTYFKLTTLGLEMTIADERQIWDNIRRNQEKILKEKRFGHRNFGTYGKHDCGYDSCPLNGLMVQKGSPLAEGHIYFESDKNRYGRIEKAEQRKKGRKKQWKPDIEEQFGDEIA